MARPKIITQRSCARCGTVFMQTHHPERHQQFCSPQCARQPKLPEADRFWPKVQGQPNGCWTWLGGKNSNGYGVFGHGPRGSGFVKAHRWAYEFLVGTIPKGLQIDHLCRNRICVNPTHLEPVTQRENILRGESFIAACARQTHCKFGHPFDAVNTRVDRNCRVCCICQQQRYARRNLARRMARQKEGTHFFSLRERSCSTP